ncbi:coiled-coil domain-containing protein 93 [Blastocystis sp. ATCC 50177/Nand II]|uniref:Coiled-coil domain-containing protein 93 n=1 Tax=Blastocystis sp. subtype 1 (strain ATCC 50177 / NandII) TaxID=478820 RepID=A0A196SN37_BLAHN|nr:coiled-coil domain-containing protein 93 [Blastocystis sp. ATCC 50177/Nand II]
MKRPKRKGFDSVVSILDEIGYYGVKVHKREELDPFETLVGGLSWCIGYIRPEFNRNIAYSADMSLGKKIAISERIIVCLQQMNYPNSIWPQQIQGMDYLAIESLLLWLKDQIVEIRNSLPAYESLAAQQAFADEFVFSEEDCPSQKHFKLWFAHPPQPASPPPAPPAAFPSSLILSPCDVRNVAPFSTFLATVSYDPEDADTASPLSLPDSFATPSPIDMELAEGVRSAAEVVLLLRVKQERVEAILRLRQRRQERGWEAAECRKQQLALQEHYQQAEVVIHDLTVNERNEETVAKLQELKNLLKLLESLSLQRTHNQQVFEAELARLHKKTEAKKAAMKGDQEQCAMIAGIAGKVTQSLGQLLEIYRGINLDILRNRCVLERIPSRPELLFYESEIKEFITVISERTAHLSRCHDILNSLRDMKGNCVVHLEFLQSMLNALTNKKTVVLSASVLMNDKLNSVIQQLSKVVQQYNIELKKRNRAQKAASDNQAVIMEKVRLHAKMMHTFNVECDNNKALKKRLRELQSLRW